jgi:predicted site-specific integrase-resolvase
MKVSIGKAAEILGVHPETLRRWEREGLITPERTPTNRRMYDTSQLARIKPRNLLDEKVTVAYARVSSNDQKNDLETQIALLESFCTARGWTYEIISDLGSGLNYKKKGLQKLIRLICQGEMDRLVITHKDRLLRFGSEIVFSMCEQFGIDVVIVNKSETDISFEEELVQDVLEIITVFSARMYGSKTNG